MAKFIGQMVMSLVVVGFLFLFVKSLPDIARYIKLSEM